MKENLISKNVEKMDASGVRKMFEMAKKIKNPIDLTIGMPNFAIPKNIKKEAIKSIKKNKNYYTHTTGIDELKIAILEKLNKKNNIKTQKQNILITNAVSGALSNVLTTLLNPLDQVLIFDPYFVAYKQLVIQNGATPIFVKTKKDFSMDLEDLENKITNKSKLILINTPNNPTGKVYLKSQLKQLAKIAKKNNLIIVSDEIYEDFVYQKNKHFSIGSIYENTISLFGFSKSCAMTGWRIGYLCAPEFIIKNIIKVQQFSFVCAPTPFQFASIEALKTDISKHIKEFEKQKNLIYKELKDLYKLEKSQGAFYYFIKYPYNPEKFIQDCIDNSLLIVPGNIFSENNNYFRISYASSKENIKKAIKIFKKLAKNNTK